MGDDVNIKALAALVAFFIAGVVSYKVSQHTLQQNRKTEWEANEKAGELTQADLHWTIAHIRDDIGSIHNLIFLTNGLLAAILAALIF
jgi:hypothetical protein